MTMDHSSRMRSAMVMPIVKARTSSQKAFESRCRVANEVRTKEVILKWVLNSVQSASLAMFRTCLAALQPLDWATTPSIQYQGRLVKENYNEANAWGLTLTAPLV